METVRVAAGPGSEGAQDGEGASTISQISAGGGWV